MVLKRKQVKVVFGFSGRASLLWWLWGHDPNMCNGYRVVGAFSSKPKTAGVEFCEEHGIPCDVVPYAAWLGPKQERTQEELNTIRNAYFQRIDEIIQKYQPDIIILAGFMLIIPKWFVEKYENRILNVHPSSFALCDVNGVPVYRGMHAVQKQIDDGLSEMASTIHIVTHFTDHGPVVCISEGLAVEGRTADEQQELMKYLCDGPAGQRALELLCGADDPIAYLSALAKQQGF